MVESKEVKPFDPSGDEKILLVKHLSENIMIDPGFKKNAILTEEEAKIRAKLITEIEYEFQLALQKGNYFLGKASINFYLLSEPKAGELFLNLQAIAISDLMINDIEIKDQGAFVD